MELALASTELELGALESVGVAEIWLEETAPPLGSVGVAELGSVGATEAGSVGVAASEPDTVATPTSVGVARAVPESLALELESESGLASPAPSEADS